MADIARASPSVSGHHSRRPPSRLQRRAPASLQISPISDWNVAIPLLSPLVSPASSPNSDRTADIKSRPDDQRRRAAEAADKSSSAAAVFKKWQHPAAPFCSEPAPMVRPFVPV